MKGLVMILYLFLIGLSVTSDIFCSSPNGSGSYWSALTRKVYKAIGDPTIEQNIIGLGDKEEKHKTKDLYDKDKNDVAQGNVVEADNIKMTAVRAEIVMRHGLEFHNTLCRFNQTNDAVENGKKEELKKYAGGIAKDTIPSAKKFLDINKPIMPDFLIKGLNKSIDRAEEKCTKIFSSSMPQSSSIPSKSSDGMFDDSIKQLITRAKSNPELQQELLKALTADTKPPVISEADGNGNTKQDQQKLTRSGKK